MVFGSKKKKEPEPKTSHHAPAAVNPVLAAIIKENTDFSRRLNIIMDRQELTIEELAARVQVKPSVIVNYLNGGIAPSIRNIRTLAMALDVNPARLLTNDWEQKEAPEGAEQDEPVDVDEEFSDKAEELADEDAVLHFKPYTRAEQEELIIKRLHTMTDDQIAVLFHEMNAYMDEGTDMDAAANI